jgi:hypothetical protein
MMSDAAMVVFAEETASEVLDDGGTQAWVLNYTRAKRCRYVVLCQNARADGRDEERHGRAFMVGRVDDLVPSTKKLGPSTKRKDRWLVTFSEYAVIDKPGVWRKWQNPVRYTTLAALGIDAKTLKFQAMPAGTREKLAQVKAAGSLPRKGMTIAEAKEALALTFGVAPEAIEITIRG